MLLERAFEINFLFLSKNNNNKRIIGVYDGHSINRDCFLTALRVICFIGRYSDNRNGCCLTFKGGALDVPYDDIARLERYVRMVK